VPLTHVLLLEVVESRPRLQDEWLPLVVLVQLVLNHNQMLQRRGDLLRD